MYEHETIYGDEVDLLIEGKSAKEVSAYIEKKKQDREREAREKAEEAARKEREARERAEALRKKAAPLGNANAIIVPEKEKTSETDRHEDAAPVIEIREVIESDPSATDGKDGKDGKDGQDVNGDKTDKADKADKTDRPEDRPDETDDDKNSNKQ